VQVTRATFIPLLASGNTQHLDAGVVREEYCADLTLVYSFGPPFGRRVVTQADLEQMELTPRALRRAAFDQLEMLAIERAQYHGQPPSLMLSFDGLESSLLLATEFWTRLQGILPGELVVGVPARDVVIVTGSQLQQGLEKVRRAVDRVFFAGDENLLTRSLLVRRGGTWEPFDRPARPAARPAAHAHTADRPPRQYQEHPSWPGERVPVASARDGRPGTEAPSERPIGRPTPLAPAASTGMMPRPAATSLPPMPTPMPTGPMSTGPMPTPMSTGPSPAMPARSAPTSPSGLPTRVPHVSAPPISRSGPAMPPAASPASPIPATGPMATGPSPSGGTVSRTGAHAARMPDLARRAEQARLADAAQYSAIPYSAVPQSSVPYSAVPYSAIPSSAVPSSAVPYSSLPYSGGRSSAPVSPGYPQPAFSRGARSRHSQAKPPYRDDAYPTSGGSYTGQHTPVSPAPYPFSAPSGAARPSPSPSPSPSSYGAPSYPGSGYAPNPPYREYERDAAQPQGYPSWSETSANDTFSGLFARSDAPSARSGFDGRSGPRARFTR
jgi:hypothetical protein